MPYEITKVNCPIRMTYDPSMKPVSEGLYYWDWRSEEFGERWLLIETSSQKRHMFWSDAALYRGEPINEFGTEQLTEHIMERYGPFSTPVHRRVTFLTKNYSRPCYRVFEESAEDVIE